MTILLLLFDLILVATLLGLALAALTSSEPSRAATLFIAFGIWLSLVWARLQAPDLALAEAAIGAGFGGALMLAAARRTAHRASRNRRAEPAKPSDARTP